MSKPVSEQIKQVFQKCFLDSSGETSEIYTDDIQEKVLALVDAREKKLRELGNLVKKWPYVRKNQMPNFISHGTFNRLKEAIENYEEWFTNFQKKFVEVATVSYHQNEGSGSLNGQEAKDEGASPSSSGLGVESALKETKKQ